ncbi:MAG: GNAT family N-acetyltransferase [Gemmatimonadaceae bacterium]|nr:GNAT family N-acetyltransferase [Gemmatimonadaceae bacterium]
MPSGQLDDTIWRALVTLCDAAYEEPTAPFFADVGAGVHVLALDDDALVAHAMWVTRDLQSPGHAAWSTAYVELVATHPTHQRRGYATAVLRALAEQVRDFDLAALSPSDPAFYARLGWEPWRGPLSVRTADGLASTPEEEIMILRLPRTPASLDVDAPLSVEWRPGEVW